MGIGVISLSTGQKREQAGPPFVAGSADNGLSVDPVSGRIVLGNDPGAVGDPAQLLNSREIQCTGRFITLRDPLREYTEYAAGHVEAGDAVNVNRLETTGMNTVTDGAGGFEARVSLDNNFENFELSTDRGNQVVVFRGNGAPSAILDPVTSNWQFGQTQGFFSNGTGASLDVVGTLTGEILVDGSQAGAVQLNADPDKGKLFTNAAGAVTFTLPQFRIGLHYLFCVQQAANLIVTADAADTLNVNNVVSAAGGTATNATIGSFLHMYCIAANQWVAGSFTGAWVVV
jgi:hypothetical protein